MPTNCLQNKVKRRPLATQDGITCNEKAIETDRAMTLMQYKKIGIYFSHHWLSLIAAS